jgi:hypothetical protein
MIDGKKQTTYIWDALSPDKIALKISSHFAKIFGLGFKLGSQTL